MSSKSNNNGRAYEYIWINLLQEEFSIYKKTTIINNSSLIANEKAWNSIDIDMKNKLLLSAKSAVKKIIELEPNIIENDDTELILECQQDNKGRIGDVRDIVIKNEFTGWEVGLSIKHNNSAVKHSRLSHKLDFGQDWLSIPCSDDYWNDINKIFDNLKYYKDNKVKWSSIIDKGNIVYKPLLTAFMNEIERMYKVNDDLPVKMMEYLLGSKDYYKVVSMDSNKVTLISCYNMKGTLNQNSGIILSSIHVPIVELPTELIALRFKKDSLNTLEMYLNNGWQLKFRIHNASDIVELSLKFDIQIIGIPNSILRIECNWQND